MVLLVATAASASPCGDTITAQGMCETKTRVVWCEDGMVKQLDCAGGQLCAWNELSNAFDCLGSSCTALVPGKEHEEAQQIPTTGICTGDHDAILWCENGELKDFQCATGTQCEWVEDLQAHDCVAKWADPPEHSADEPGSDGGGTEDDPAAAHQPEEPANQDYRGGVPPIQKRSEIAQPAAETNGDADAGCMMTPGSGAGAQPLSWLSLLLLLGWFELRRVSA